MCISFYPGIGYIYWENISYYYIDNQYYMSVIVLFIQLTNK